MDLREHGLSLAKNLYVRFIEEACLKALNEIEVKTVSSRYVVSELTKAIAKAKGEL